MLDLRRYALPVSLWFYGVAISVTLVSIWGRAVVVDTNLMAQAAADASSSALVADQVERWLAEELADVPGIDRGTALEVASDTVSDPTVVAPIETLVGDFVAAAAVPRGELAVVDVASALAPAVPAITASLAAQGLAVDEGTVASYVGSLDPIVVRDPDVAPAVGAGSSAARSLYLATVVGVVLALVSGATAVRLSEERRAMVRSLLTRLAVSALTFAIMFRLGAWVLDPGAGRAPVRTAVSRLAGAKLWLPVAVAVVAGVAAMALRRVRASDRWERAGRHPQQPDDDEEHAGRHQQPVQ